MDPLPPAGALLGVADGSPGRRRLPGPLPAHPHLFSSSSVHDVTDLTEMFVAYLQEEFERTGQLAMGMPVAGFLRTIMLSCDEHSAGFAAFDAQRGSLELLYVRPSFRGRGIAGSVVRHLTAGSAPLALKAPLSPGGQALADRHGLSVAHSSASEAADSERAVCALMQRIRAVCRHRSAPGAPGRICPRCFRKYAGRYAERVIQAFVTVDQHARRTVGR